MCEKIKQNKLFLNCFYWLYLNEIKNFNELIKAFSLIWPDEFLISNRHLFGTIQKILEK